MEKLNELLKLLERYYDKPTSIETKMIQGEPAIILPCESGEWYGHTWEEAFNEAINDVREWIEEE